MILAACAADATLQTSAKQVPTARATYIQDTGALLANPAMRAQLERLVRAQRITTVVPYALGPLVVAPTTRASLEAWIDEVHRDGGRVVLPIAGVDRLAALADSTLWIDGLVSELEFWNKPERPLGDLLALLAAMRGWNNHGHPFEVGAYLGSPSANEAARLAKAVDFVFLDYSIRSPDLAWQPRLRERFGWFAGVAVWPIFYATGEVDMKDALRAEGLAQAEQRFRAEAPNQVAGFVYFTFEATPW